MPMFTKKPQTVKAIRYLGCAVDVVEEFMDDPDFEIPCKTSTYCEISHRSFNWRLKVNYGDFVVRHENGKYEIYSSDYFMENFE